MYRGRRVHGRVLSASRAPLEGALVRVFPCPHSPGHVVNEFLAPILSPGQESIVDPVLTDNTGRYEIEIVEGKRDSCILATADGFAQDSSPCLVSSSHTTGIDPIEYDFILESGCEISGRVIDEQQAPIPEAVVWVKGQSNSSSSGNEFIDTIPPLAARTGLDGTFRVTGLSPTRELVLSVSPPELRTDLRGVSGHRIVGFDHTIEIILKAKNQGTCLAPS